MRRLRAVSSRASGRIQKAASLASPREPSRITPRPTTVKRAGVASAGAAAALLALSACAGGAQNTNPAAKQPAASAQQTNPTQVNGSACAPASYATLQALSRKTKTGTANPGFVVKISGGAYVAAFLGENTTHSSTIGLWATTGDPTTENFGATLFSLNSDADTHTKFSTTPPSPFTATATAARKALDCAKAASSR